MLGVVVNASIYGVTSWRMRQERLSFLVHHDVAPQTDALMSQVLDPAGRGFAADQDEETQDEDAWRDMSGPRADDEQIERPMEHLGAKGFDQQADIHYDDDACRCPSTRR